MTPAYSSDQRGPKARESGRPHVSSSQPGQQALFSSPGIRNVYPSGSLPDYIANGDRGHAGPPRAATGNPHSSLPQTKRPSRNNNKKQRPNSSHLPRNHKNKVAHSRNRVMSSDANSKSTSANLVKRHLKLHGQVGPNNMQTIELHHRPVVKPHNAGGRDPESELTTSFDPMKDRHMWTMWRTAVTGRIVDEAKRLEQLKKEKRLAVDGEEVGVYGKALIVPPLKRFIKLGEGSKEIAQNLMSQGQGRLLAPQFVYYGLPRVYVSKPPPRPQTRPNE